jgi:hypothetical protein
MSYMGFGVFGQNSMWFRFEICRIDYLRLGNFIAQLLHFIGCLILLVGYCKFHYEILLPILGFVFF